MTRDEAVDLRIEKFSNDISQTVIPPDAYRKVIENEVDFLVALGILKLDEPKSAQQKFESGMVRAGYKPEGIAIQDMRAALDAAGLRIVEK